jgi:DNA-binding transcriptional ArsR family regulator
MTMDDADTADPRPLFSEQEREQFLAGLEDSLTVGAIELMVKRPVSPREVATALERPLEEVRRHLDRLRSTGLITVVDAVELDGTSEPFYRGPFIPFHDSEEWAELDEDRKQAHLSLLVRSLKAELDEAIEGETLGSWPDFHLSRRPFLIDEQGLDELCEVFDTALYEMVPIIEAAEKRQRERGGESIRGSAALMLFKLPDLDR